MFGIVWFELEVISGKGNKNKNLFTLQMCCGECAAQGAPGENITLFLGSLITSVVNLNRNENEFYSNKS